MHNHIFKFLFLTLLIILSGCSNRNMNMSCRTDSDCGAGKFCWSIMGGGKECRLKTATKVDDTSIEYKSTYIPKPAELAGSSSTRIPSNQADEQTAKNTEQKEITTNVIWEKDGIAYLPNETRPFTGKYVEYCPNGKLHFEYLYDNGKQVKRESSGIKCGGDETYNYQTLDKEGKSSILTERRNGIVYLPNDNKPYTGEWELFYPNGKIHIRRHFVNGKEEGTQTWWHENGQKHVDGNNKNGEIDGLSNSWYDNGQKKCEGKFINSGLDGKSTCWYSNGHKESELNYKNDKQDGVQTWWYENGQKKSESRYKDGEQNGLEIRWYENGQKESESSYKDGERNGVEIEWNENGIESRESIWKNGELIQMNGKLIHAPQKTSVQTKNSSCESYSDLAKSVMTARQIGVAMSEVMNTISSENTKQLVIAAYEKPRFTSEGYKTKSIEDFRDKAYLDCIKAAR